MALNAPVLTVKGADVEPAATVTEEGMTSPDKPVLVKLTVAPLAGAALESVTAQLLLALAPSVVGLHCREEITAAAASVRLTVCEEPL